MSKRDKYLHRLQERCGILRSRTGLQWEQELHAIEWAIEQLEQRGDVSRQLEEAIAILRAMSHEYNKDQFCDSRKINGLIERGETLIRANSDGGIK